MGFVMFHAEVTLYQLQSGVAFLLEVIENTKRWSRLDGDVISLNDRYFSI